MLKRNNMNQNYRFALEEIKNFHCEEEQEDWMEWEQESTDPRDNFQIHRKLEAQIKALPCYESLNFQQRVEFLNVEKEILFEQLDDDIVTCEVCKEICDRKCKNQKCRFECMDNTHMQSACCFEVTSGLNLRNTSASTFFKSKHRQHLLDNFFGTSIQKAILFTYQYFMRDCESVSAFVTMIGEWNETIKKDTLKKRYPYQILFEYMESYGPGISLESFLTCFLQIYNNSNRILENHYGMVNTKNSIYTLMRQLGLVHIFSDLQCMDDISYDFDDEPVRITKKTVSLFACYTEEQLERFRCLHCPGKSPEDVKKHNQLVKEEQEKLEKTRKEKELLLRRQLINREASRRSYNGYDNYDDCDDCFYGGSRQRRINYDESYYD